MKKAICGIDVGGTTIKIGLFDLQGSRLKHWEIVTNKSEQGRYILSDIRDSIVKNCEDLTMILGYGFGVPAPVIDGKIKHAVNIGWVDMDIKAEFSKLVNNDLVFVDNDANVAALGESLSGASKGYYSSVMLTLGTGIGGGVIIDHSIIKGAQGAAGEIGHLLVVPQGGLRCNCGNHGCLETVASATGIKNLYEKYYLENHPEVEETGYSAPSAKMIFDAAKKEDILSLKVVDEVSYYLAYACHIMSVVVNPDIIVIGGGVSKAGEFLLQKIREEFAKITYKSVSSTKIELAQLGNDAGMVGAMGMVKEHD